MSCSYFSIFLAVPIRWPSPGCLARRPQERDSRQLTEGWAPRGTRTAPRHSRLDQPWAPSQGGSSRLLLHQKGSRLPPVWFAGNVAPAGSSVSKGGRWTPSRQALLGPRMFLPRGQVMPQ